MTEALFYFFILLVCFSLSLPVGLSYFAFIVYLSVTGYTPQYVPGTDILDVYAVSFVVVVFAIAYKLGGVLPWNS